MGELIHVSKVRIYGVHGGIKKFYGVEPEQEAPATLDHLVAAVAG